MTYFFKLLIHSVTFILIIFLIYTRKFCDGHIILVFLIFVQRQFFEECFHFDFLCCCWKALSFLVIRSKSFLNPHVVSLPVCLIYFLVLTSVKIGQQPRNFGMFLNYIGLLYIRKIIHAVPEGKIFKTCWFDLTVLQLNRQAPEKNINLYA